jgi:hypothetical protein
VGVILTASSNGVETGLQIAYFEVHTDWVRSLMLVLMEFSFSKTDFKSGLRATGSMMAGNACVAFLILGNRSWENLVLLMLAGLTLILLTSLTFEFKNGDSK